MLTHYYRGPASTAVPSRPDTCGRTYALPVFVCLAVSPGFGSTLLAGRFKFSLMTLFIVLIDKH